MSKDECERITRAPLMNDGPRLSANVVADAENVTDAENAVVDAGREAWERRKADARKCWDDFKQIGKAFQVGRKQAMARAGTSEPRGKGYNQCFRQWLHVNRFDDFDASDRAKLMRLMDELPEVEAWRTSLPPDTRLKLNHPSAVWEGWSCPDRGGAWRALQQAGAAQKQNDGSANATVRARETESEDALSAGSLLVKANKAAGLANDCRQFAGELNGTILRAVKEACRAWAETADLFEAGFSERQDA
jgi:hypothetical protein